MDVKCPQCGTTTSPEAPEFPICPGCRDNLRRCGYCEHFDDGEEACLNAKARRRPEAEADLDPLCPEHVSRLLVPAVRRRIHPAIWVFAGITFLLTVGYTVQQLIGPAATQVQFSAEGPYLVHPNELITIRFEMTHFSGGPTGPLRLQLAGSLFRRFRRVSIRPAPMQETVDSNGDHRYLHYPGLMPREGRQIALDLRCPSSGIGTAELACSLLGEDGTEYGRIRLPMVVQASRRQGGANADQG